MKFGKALLKIGLGVVKDVIPGAGIIIDTINEFLPDDKKLPSTATGEQVQNALHSLPPDKQAELLGREIDLEIQEIQSHERIQIALAQADAAGSSTRPAIAYMMAWAVLLVVIPVAWTFCYAIASNKPEIVKAIADNYLMLLAIIGTPTTVLLNYFGNRSKDKAMRQAVAHGHPPPVSPLGFIGKLLK